MNTLSVLERNMVHFSFFWMYIMAVGNSNQWQNCIVCSNYRWEVFPHRPSTGAPSLCLWHFFWEAVHRVSGGRHGSRGSSFARSPSGSADGKNIGEDYSFLYFWTPCTSSPQCEALCVFSVEVEVCPVSCIWQIIVLSVVGWVAR